MADQTLPFVPATVAGMMPNPQDELTRNLQQRQKNMLAAGRSPASVSNMMPAVPTGTTQQGLIGG